MKRVRFVTVLRNTVARYRGRFFFGPRYLRTNWANSITNVVWLLLRDFHSCNSCDSWSKKRGKTKGKVELKTKGQADAKPAKLLASRLLNAVVLHAKNNSKNVMVRPKVGPILFPTSVALVFSHGVRRRRTPLSYVVRLIWLIVLLWHWLP